jgi:hypothetical protein
MRSGIELKFPMKQWGGRLTNKNTYISFLMLNSTVSIYVLCTYPSFVQLLDLFILLVYTKQKDEASILAITLCKWTDFPRSVFFSHGPR